jgi:hypothetical protein
VLDGVKAGAFGEHPAGKDTLHLAGELHLVDLDEGGGIRGLGRRSRVADPRRHFQRAECDGLVHGNFEMRDAARHLVERGEHRDRVLEGFRRSQIHLEPGRQSEGGDKKHRRTGQAARA